MKKRILKQTIRQRWIATFLLVVFLLSVIPTNALYASNGGPNAPEAASFEPVDATDMVNLVTGQYSYVLPLLNVPSPEGGYPVVLSYHAGIAMDQQASWAGLGWNVNPGSITRSVNGYADDCKSSSNTFFYDQENIQTYESLGLNYSNGSASVGLGFNWGSNQSLGGYVSCGVGFDLGPTASASISARAGTGGSSIGVGVGSIGGLSVGVGITSENSISASIGYVDTNGTGYSVSSGGAVSISGSAMSVDYSENSLGVSLKTFFQVNASGIGTGVRLGSRSRIENSDYKMRQSSSGFGLYVPTPVGFFGVNYSRTKVDVSLRKREGTVTLGPLLFYDYSMELGDSGTLFKNESMDVFGHRGEGEIFLDTPDEISNDFMLPNYDSYSVQSQGLSGVISPRLFKNGVLTQTGRGKNGYRISYPYNQNCISNGSYYHTCLYGDYPEPLPYFRFNKAYFYFDNEISSYNGYADVTTPQFNIAPTSPNVVSSFAQWSQSEKPRRKTANYIEYFTAREFDNPNYILPNKDFNVGYYDRGVIGFKITDIQGKTYHYSLPVYNHLTFSRTIGAIQNKPEEQSYLEDRLTTKYATHWLLTAVTGPDFVDNGDRLVGEGDLGYWVNFEYGLWSDAFTWKAPYKNDYIIDAKNPNIKTWVKGLKQIYYLDRIKTRTHTALFVKSERTESKSDLWDYWSVYHHPNASNAQRLYQRRFVIPEQTQLKLDKIILVKNEDDELVKNQNQSNEEIEFRLAEEYEYFKFKYNCRNNLIDNEDDFKNTLLHSIKVVDFSHDSSLVKGDARLTLNSVEFKGKQSIAVLPPYRFQYRNNSLDFNIDDQDDWGYHKDFPDYWSLKKIITPTGGRIIIDYERNKVKSVHQPSTTTFSNNDASFLIKQYDDVYPHENNKFIIEKRSNSLLKGIKVGDKLEVNYLYIKNHYAPAKTNLPNYSDNYSYSGVSTIIEKINENEFVVELDNGPLENSIGHVGNVDFLYEVNATYINSEDETYSPGIRTSKITIEDDFESNGVEFKYGHNEDGIGYVSYIPFAQNVSRELAYSSLLPAPRPMYEYVTVTNRNSNNDYLSKNIYKYDILKNKTLSQNEISFDKFLKIKKSVSNSDQSSTGWSNVKVKQGYYDIETNYAALGRLLQVSVLNHKGQLISDLKNDYYDSKNIPDNIGVTKEAFQNYKLVDFYNEYSQDIWSMSASSFKRYPNILKSVTETNNGYSNTIRYENHDPITGVSREQIHISSNGRSLKTKIIPAYEKYDSMGSLVDDSNNKNMLSQNAATYSYILEGDIWKEINVEVTTWNNDWQYVDMAGDYNGITDLSKRIWRKHKSYVWNGARDSNGVIVGFDTHGDFGGFNWTVGRDVTQGNQWKKMSETTIYNHFSVPLEAKDINGNRVATKMSDNDTKVIAFGNAGYHEVFYSGAEYEPQAYEENIFFLEPEVRINNAAIEDRPQYVHTGTKAVRLNNAGKLGVLMKPDNPRKGGKYKLSVWVHNDNTDGARVGEAISGTLSRFDEEKTAVAGDWTLMTHYFDVPNANEDPEDDAPNFHPYVTSADASLVVYDDFKLHPIASSVTGYVYNEYDELSYIIAPNGLATHFVYDYAGRLVKTYEEIVKDEENGIDKGGFVLKSKSAINYKNFK